MSKEWLRQKDKSNYLMLRIIVWCALHLGRGFVRCFLYPISFYYYIFHSKSRAASKQYLTKALKRKPNCLQILKHFHTFSATLLDRVFLAAGSVEDFKIQAHGLENLKKYVEQQQGLILLGSHHGSFEALRALANHQDDYDLDVKILMHTAISKNINTFLHTINPKLADNIIEGGNTQALLQAKQYLENGSLLGILGDRVYPNIQTSYCNFLGEKAEFPTGPLIAASILQVPVLLFFGIYRGGNRYDIYFEVFAEKITCPRENRQAIIQEWLKKYVRRLEFYVAQQPYNWFNFYDYWSLSKDD